MSGNSLIAGSGDPDAVIASGLKTWGPEWSTDILRARDAMLALYEPLLRASDVRRHQVEAGVAYGSHPRQAIDVFAPPGATRAPVLLFIHGGAFVRGERDLSPFVHANVAAEFAAHGFVAANAGYRLAPSAPWPEGARDVLAALAWMRKHAVRYGGDPGNIFLMGHSAGGAHCASALWDAQLDADNKTDISGLILISPRLRADTGADNPNREGVLAYYGSDIASHQSRAPLAMARARHPTLLVSAQYENPGLHIDARDALALMTSGAGPGAITSFELQDHNHMSIVAQFNTPGNILGARIRAWCEGTTGG